MADVNKYNHTYLNMNLIEIWLCMLECKFIHEVNFSTMLRILLVCIWKKYLAHIKYLFLPPRCRKICLSPPQVFMPDLNLQRSFWNLENVRFLLFYTPSTNQRCAHWPVKRSTQRSTLFYICFIWFICTWALIEIKMKSIKLIYFLNRPMNTT